MEGRELVIEEMPQGCFIGNPNTGNVILVSSYEDAVAIIKSLNKMIEIQFSKEANDQKET